jgi:hypothetical protein
MVPDPPTLYGLTLTAFAGGIVFAAALGVAFARYFRDYNGLGLAGVALVASLAVLIASLV